MLLLITGLFGFAGLFVDDKVMVYTCLFLSWVGFSYLCYINRSSQLSRAVVGIIITVVYGGLCVRARIVDSNRAQEDSYRNLIVEAYMPPDMKIADSVFTIRNNGRVGIGKHEVSCFVPYLAAENGVVMFEKDAKTLVIWPEALPIRAGGDAESDSCLKPLRNNNGEPLAVCADLVLQVDYELESQPGVTRQKKFRFVFRESEGPNWHQYPLEYKGSYCSP